MADFPQTTEELEQYISDYMDAHIAERIGEITTEEIDAAVRRYMSQYGAAMEDNGADGDVPLVADTYFTDNEGARMETTTMPMAESSGGTPTTYIQARIRALALAAASLVQAGDVVAPVVEQTEADVAIEANKMNVWSLPMENLTVTFSAGPVKRVAHYMMQFTVSGSTFTLTLPVGVRWVDGDEPDWNDGSIYQVSVQDGLAIAAEWPNE